MVVDSSKQNSAGAKQHKAKQTHSDQLDVKKAASMRVDRGHRCPAADLGRQHCDKLKASTDKMACSAVKPPGHATRTSSLSTGAPLGWKVKASERALNTTNPIREIIETMNLAENPDKKVIPLSIGDPTIFGNLKPCRGILEALQRANASGKFYGYQTAAGMESAREAVAEYHFKCTGNRVKLHDVILSSGCSHAIDLCVCVLTGKGQNILIPRPGFPLYKTLTSVYGIQYKQYNLLAEKNWSIDLEHLESLIDENTAAIVINNPSNPCGSVFSRRHLRQILRLAERHRLPIIADEIYDKFVFTPDQEAADGLLDTDHSRGSLPTQFAVDGPKMADFQPAAGGPSEQHKDKSDANSDDNGANNIENRRPVAKAHTDYISAHPAVKMVSSHESGSAPSGAKLEASGDRDSADDCYQLEDLSQSFNEPDEPDDHSDPEDDDDDDDDPDQDQDNCDPDNAKFKYVPFTSLSALSDTVPILTCGGISKTCLIPGLRLGWIIINDKRNIFDASVRFGLSKLTQRLMGPNSLVQGALRDILTNVPESFYKSTMDFIFQNAKLCHRRLNQVIGLQPFMPQGSMYLMVKFNPKLFPRINGDLDFTSKLMNEESVLVLPGKCFDFPNFFRVCLTVPTNVMEEALDRIQQFCERHAKLTERDIDTCIEVAPTKLAAVAAHITAGPGAGPQIQHLNTKCITAKHCNGNSSTRLDAVRP